jgi:hypothetical protein
MAEGIDFFFGKTHPGVSLDTDLNLLEASVLCDFAMKK